MKIHGFSVSRRDVKLLRALQSGVHGQWAQIDALASGAGESPSDVVARIESLAAKGLVRFPVTPFVGALNLDTGELDGVGGEVEKTSARITDEGTALLGVVDGRRKWWSHASWVVPTVVSAVLAIWLAQCSP